MTRINRAGWLLFFFVLAFCLPAVVNGQQIASQVNVLVDGLPADETVANLVGLKPGDSISDYQLDLILKRLMRTGLYASADIYKSLDSQPIITINLKRNILIKGLKIFAPAGPAKLIKSQLGYLRDGNILDPAVKTRAINDLKNLLREEGWFSSGVEFEIKT